MSYEPDDYEPDDHDLPRPTRRSYCGGPSSYYGSCGATDCGTCYPGGCDEDDDEDKTHEATSSKFVTARKARYEGTTREIRVGDRVVVTTGFLYLTGGPRQYLAPKYRRVAKGPAWG